MNKLVKASVAAAAGIALLMGGAGSLALWNDSASVATGSVTTGRLTLASAGAGVWGKNSGAGVALWVPGNSDTFTQDFTVTATGDQMSATLTAAYTGVAASGFTSSAVVTIAGQTAVAGVFTLAPGTYTAHVVVSVAFNATGTANQNVTVPLGKVALTLSLVAPAN